MLDVGLFEELLVNVLLEMPFIKQLTINRIACALRHPTLSFYSVYITPDNFTHQGVERLRLMN